MRGGWLSDDADKARAERYFLASSPIWMAAVALVIVTGWIRQWGDEGYMLFSVLAAAPAVFGPLVLGPRTKAGAFALKLNVWCAILVAFGTYFGTHYFFDLMGMRYGFPVTWVSRAEVVGRSPGDVPLFMYPLTQAYFVSYYAALVVVARGLRRRLGEGLIVRAIVVVVLAYTIAFAETFFMANEAIETYFAYADRERMLAVGSFGYAVYFVIGVPMVRNIDEREAWTLGRVVVQALATCMLVLVALEVWAKLIGPL